MWALVACTGWLSPKYQQLMPTAGTVIFCCERTAGCAIGKCRGQAVSHDKHARPAA